jgi:hypothetical protein
MEKKSIKQRKFEEFQSKASYFHHKYNPGDKVTLQFLNPNARLSRVFPIDFSNTVDFICVNKSYHESIWPGMSLDDMPDNYENWPPITIKLKNPSSNEIGIYPTDLIVPLNKQIILASYYAFLEIILFATKFMGFSTMLSWVHSNFSSFENYAVSSLLSLIIFKYKINPTIYYDLKTNTNLLISQLFKFNIFFLLLLTLKTILS